MAEEHGSRTHWRVAIALGLYHEEQIAEELSGGIEAIRMGQIEAVAALGLKSSQISQLLVVPQAAHRRPAFQQPVRLSTCHGGILLQFRAL